MSILDKFSNRRDLTYEDIKYEKTAKKQARKAEATAKKSTSTKKVDVVDEVREHLKASYSKEFFLIREDSASREKIEYAIVEYVKQKGIKIDGFSSDYKKISDTIIDDILDYGPLTKLIFDSERPKDKKIEEIEVNDWNDIRITVNGKCYMTPNRFNNPSHLQRVAEKINRDGASTEVLKEDNPMVRVRLGNNIRVTIMRNPVARRSGDSLEPVTHMSIRKQSMPVIPGEKLLEWKTINPYGDALLETCINHRRKIVFYGETNSGKTGTMNSYVHRMDKELRVITVAEIDEMDARVTDRDGNPVNRTIMWEMKPNVFELLDAVKAALTFNPDALIVQECKGAEAVEVLNAGITGLQVLLTAHADSIKVLGKRFLVMFKQSGSDLSDDLILELVADAFDIAVNMTRLDDGTRKIINISEIKGYDRNTKKFDTTTLVEYVVTNTYKVDAIGEDGRIVYDTVTGKPKQQPVIEGKHVVRNPISPELVQKLLFKGAVMSDLERFSNIDRLKQEKDYEQI